MTTATTTARAQRRPELLGQTADVILTARVNFIAALAVHVMANTALTRATYDIDGGQQLLPRGV
jgi:hypothetical protein